MADNLVFNPNNPPPCLNPDLTVIAQYANSPTLLNIIHSFSLDIKGCEFYNDFYNKIWNINTANDYGLNIWGTIVGVNRTVKKLTGFFWGYNEETIFLARPYHDITGSNDNLTEEEVRTEIGTFRDFQDLEENITFDEENFRKLILAKAHANISNYTISDLNNILMYLFGDTSKGHEVYVRDNLNMTMTIVFNWVPSTFEVAIVLNAGILFKPAGVELLIEYKK